MSEKQKIRTISVNQRTWDKFIKITKLEYGTDYRYKSEMFRRLVDDAWEMKYKYKDQLNQ